MTDEELCKKLRKYEDDLLHITADRIEALELALTQSRAETAAAYERAAGIKDSRNHFEQKSASYKTRVTRLRHRQRALISALEAIRSSASINDAKYTAHIAICGWSDENLIFDARALATADQSAALDAVRAEARAQGMREAADMVQSRFDNGDVLVDAEGVAKSILAAIKGAKA